MERQYYFSANREQDKTSLDAAEVQSKIEGRAFKDSGIEWIGRIPREWNTCRFKNSYNKSNVGESIDKEYCTDNITDTLFYTAGLYPIHTVYKDFPQWKFTQDSDLLLARNGTPYIYLPLCNAVYSDHIIRVDIKECFCKKYIRYCLQQAIATVIVDSVSIATWSISLWNEQHLPFPSLAEQQHIANYLDKKCGKAHDIIIAKIGANYGMAGELPDLGKKAVVSGNSLKITLDNAKMLNALFVAIMMSAKINNGFINLVQENAQPALSLSGLNNFKIPVPPLSEQHTIASYLDTKCSEIDKLIATKRQKIDTLKEYKKSVIYEAVTGKTIIE